MSQPPSVGVGVIVTLGSQVLMIRRQNAHGSGTWSTPGGHLEYGETPEACAEREVFEETGVTIKDIRFKALTNDIFEEYGKHYITIWMEAGYQEGEPRVNAPEELCEIGWFEWSQLPEPLFLPLRNLLSGRSYS